MQTNSFSVILPVYNVEKYLDKSILSILEQTFTDFQLICVEDCSTDSSAEILDKYAKQDKRIKVIKHEKNKGLGTARNTALEFAMGKYLVCVDSDDWLDKTFLQEIFEAFENNDINSVWTKYWRYNEKNDFATIAPAYPLLFHSLEGIIELSPRIIGDFPAYAWNKAYKTELIKNNNFHWIENKIFEDVYFYFDYFMSSNKVYLLDKMLYYYRVREDSITSNFNTQKIKNMFEILFDLYKLIITKGYNPQYQKSISTYAKNFSTQFKKTQLDRFTQNEYMKFTAKIEVL